MKHWFALPFMLILSACVFLPDTGALHEDISDFKGQPIRMGILTSATPFPEAEQFVEIIASDLERSGRFQIAKVTASGKKGAQIPSLDLKHWADHNFSYLVVGSALLIKSRIQLSFSLWDVQKNTQYPLSTLSTTTDELHNALRQQAHHISDRIFSSVIGVNGPFSSKLVYITANLDQAKRHYSLWLADADGHNKRVIFTSSEPIMSPSWSPDGSKISFASLQKRGLQQIFIHDWRSGNTQHVDLEKPGLIGSPAWSPDGRQLAFTLIRNGNADIYTVNLNSYEFNRLTCHNAIDTEATWSPDGKTLVFTSDRSGRPQLYEIAATGGEAKRITFRGRENAQASISPNGKHIAMLHSSQGKYRIALLDRKTGEISVLTDGELDESPSFSANGSMVIYSSSIGKKSALVTVSVDGHSKQQLSVDIDIRDPAWSPAF